MNWQRGNELLAQDLDNAVGQYDPANASTPTALQDTDSWALKRAGVWVAATLGSLITYLNAHAQSMFAQMQDEANQTAVSAGQAAASASSASSNATTATGAATSATQANTSAQTYAGLAQAWASQPSGPVNGTPNYSANYYALQAQYWSGIAQAVNVAPTTFDPAYKAASIALSNGNNTATFTGTQAGVLSTIGYATGRHYFEITFVSGSSSGNASIGLAPDSEPLANQIGYDDNSGAIAAFQSSGNTYINGSKIASVIGFSNVGDIVGVAVDADRKLVWFRTNGGEWNASGTADPVAGVGGLAYTLTSKLFPAVCTDASAVFSANFTGNFAATLPAGYKAWSFDAYHYVVPTATTGSPGTVLVGAGLAIDSEGTLTADTYYDIATLNETGGAISLDLTTPAPSYHIVLNDPASTFALANLNLPPNKALRITLYLEQGTGNNTISTWDATIKWVGPVPILAFTKGARNVITLETIDGVSWAGYYIGQINP